MGWGRRGTGRIVLESLAHASGPFFHDEWMWCDYTLDGRAQTTVVRAFSLGTGAWALWVDLDRKKVRIRHYVARVVIPLAWDEDDDTVCAFVTRAFYRGKAVDQLQMHLKGGAGFSADYS